MICPRPKSSRHHPFAKSCWLVKPRQSAGGSRIRFWRGEPIAPTHYCQEWIEGEPCSALFCGQRDGNSLFLGATRQLIGVPWLRAGGFRYCGNIGPVPLPEELRTPAPNGAVLTEACALRGFFGVDFMLQGDVPWLIEVNPRLTAGLEVLERAAGRSFFSFHRAAFMPSGCPADAPAFGQDAVCGKAILFAKAPLLFPDDGPWLASLCQPWASDDKAAFADIPMPKYRIEKGQPILTLLARASNPAQCLELLRTQARNRALSLWLGEP